MEAIIGESSVSEYANTSLISFADTDVFHEKGIKVRVQMVELLGSEYCVHAFMGDNKIIFKTNTKKVIKDGDEVYIEFDTNEIHGFEKETSRALF